MRFLLFFPALVAVAFGFPLFDLNEGRNFMIRHNGTNYDICVGVPNSRMDDGAPVIFYACLPDITDQHWSFNGTLLVNRNSGKCMAVTTRRTGEQVIQQSPCNADSLAQQFYWSGDGDIYAGSSAQFGKCVDPTGAVGGTQLSVKTSACTGNAFKQDVVA